jgi:acyl-CoA hydrolase
MLDGGKISGVGGAADFAHAGSLYQEGIGIVAHRSTPSRIAASWMIPCPDGACSLSRGAIDIVMTEHGAANLQTANAMECAERIISVAAPDTRADLPEPGEQIAAGL